MAKKDPARQEQRRMLMLNEPVHKVIPKMAVPTIISFLITSIYKWLQGMLGLGFAYIHRHTCFRHRDAQPVHDFTETVCISCDFRHGKTRLDLFKAGFNFK